MSLLFARSAATTIAAAARACAPAVRPMSSPLPSFVAALSVPVSGFRSARLFSSAAASSSSAAAPPAHGLSHVDASLRPTMVDVGAKVVTARSATAQCVVLLPDDVAALFDTSRNDWSTAKGPVLTTAIIAGTQAVKRTSDLIPFCHPLPLDSCKFHTLFLSLPHPRGSRALRLECTVKCHARTGIEMEALTGASVAGLTVYDMLKALSHHIVLSDIKLLSKEGGKSKFVDTRTGGDNAA